MESIEGRKIINKMQRDLLKSGVNVAVLIDDLKKLRPYAIEEQDPLLTKVIRLAYEHLENFGAFKIPVPSDESVDEDELIEAEEDNGLDDEGKSVDYLLSIMSNGQNKINRLDLTEYKVMLTEYSQVNS